MPVAAVIWVQIKASPTVACFILPILVSLNKEDSRKRPGLYLLVQCVQHDEELWLMIPLRSQRWTTSRPCCVSRLLWCSSWISARAREFPYLIDVLVMNVFVVSVMCRYCQENVMFWLDAEAFSALPVSIFMRRHALRLYLKYIEPKVRLNKTYLYVHA